MAADRGRNKIALVEAGYQVNKSGVSHFIRSLLLFIGLALPVGGLSLDGETLAQSGSNAGWVEIGTGSASGGGISNTPYFLGHSFAPSLAIGSDSAPIVAWDTEIGALGSNIGARRWNGAAWNDMAFYYTGKDSSSSSLAVGSNGTPIVAWHDDSSGNLDYEIYVRRWNGSAWVEMGSGSASGGNISNNDGYSYRPSLAIGPDSKPVVAWEDNNNGKAIYVRRWDGSAWVEMGAGSASGGGISQSAGFPGDPSLAIGPDGKPVVTWHNDSSGIAEIYVKRWNGSAWVEMGTGSASGGGISKNNGTSRYPSLAIGPDGKPVVAWHDDSSGNAEIYVKRWDGGAWVTMGANSASGGGISKNNGASIFPSLAIDPDGRPMVAWEDDSSGNWEIYVKRWNGSAWEEMAGSASGGGISQNSGHSEDPSLAIGPDGAPVIAWDDSSSGNWEIYVKRWNGSAWVRMGANSAGGGGVSKNDGNSWYPSLAVAPDGLFALAWQDDSYGNWNIYMRLWDGAAWVEVYPGSATGSGHTDFLAGSSLYPSLAIGPNRLLGLAWQDDSDGYWTFWIHRRQIPQQIFHHLFAPSVLYAPSSPCFVGPDEVEPNNKIAEANGPLCRGVVYRGWPNDDRDYFMLETTTAGTIKVTVSNHFKEKVQLLLYRDNHYESPAAWDNNPADGLQVELKDAQPGRYYIVIYSEKFNSTAPPYTMSVVFP